MIILINSFYSISIIFLINDVLLQLIVIDILICILKLFYSILLSSKTYAYINTRKYIVILFHKNDLHNC